MLRPEKVPHDNTKSTMLILSMGFLILFILKQWYWALWASLTISAIGIFSPWLSMKITWVWMKFGDILGYIFPKIILTLIFFLVLFPIALISKIFRRDPLMRLGKYSIYFIDVNKEATPDSFRKMW